MFFVVNTILASITALCDLGLIRNSCFIITFVVGLFLVVESLYRIAHHPTKGRLVVFELNYTFKVLRIGVLFQSELFFEHGTFDTSARLFISLLPLIELKTSGPRRYETPQTNPRTPRTPRSTPTPPRRQTQGPERRTGPGSSPLDPYILN
jgi:hypothetical protein